MKRRCWITVLLIGLLTSMIVIAQDVPDLSQGIQVLSLLADPYGANTYLIKDQFERLGWTVTFAAIGESVSPCSNLCSAFLPDIRIEDIPSIAAYDVVVVMPTPGTFYQKPDPVGDLRANECAVSLIADAYHQGLRLYTGCSGILVFGDAGVLEGASVISHRNMLRYCPDFGAVCTSGSHRVRPMIDNQLVTATNQRVWPIEIAAALARSLDLLVPITPSINSIVARDLALEETSLDIPYSTISGRTAGTPLADIGRDVCVVSDGRVLVGMTYSPQDREDVLVIKYSEAGEIVWARAIGGPGRDFAEGVCASDDGGVYIAGYTTSAGQGVEDALLIRMDASGEVVWKTTAGGADYDAAFDVCLAADGAPVLCGLTNSSGKGLSDIYTVKADAQTGTILWETTTGGPLIERGHSIVCLADGSFLIGGGTNSRGAGNLDMHLVHLGAEGEQLWIKTVGDSVYDIANAAIPLADNGFLLVGHGDHEFSEIMALTVRRMDCERNTLWMTQLGVNKEHDYGFDGVELEDGRLVIVGVTAEPVPGENDIWILVMDGSGNLLEDFTVGGPEPEWPRGICLSPDGTLIIAGQTGSYGAGSYDAMMLEVKLPSGLLRGGMRAVPASSLSDQLLVTFHAMTPQIDTRQILLIFDLDGTLNRTEATFVPTMRKVYAKHGIAYVGDDTVLRMVGETFPTFLDWLAKQGFSDDADAITQEIAVYEFDSIAQDGQLYPHVEDTLRALKDAGYLLAICTNGDMAYTQAVLGKFSLFDLFDGIKTFGDHQQTKTQMIAELLDEFQPQHAFMIGDRYHDFVAGKANGCTVVATTYGFAANGEADEVDVLLERFQDLPSIVERAVRKD